MNKKKENTWYFYIASAQQEVDLHLRNNFSYMLIISGNNKFITVSGKGDLNTVTYMYM